MSIVHQHIIARLSNETRRIALENAAGIWSVRVDDIIVFEPTHSGHVSIKVHPVINDNETLTAANDTITGGIEYFLLEAIANQFKRDFALSVRLDPPSETDTRAGNNFVEVQWLLGSVQNPGGVIEQTIHRAMRAAFDDLSRRCPGVGEEGFDAFFPHDTRQSILRELSALFGAPTLGR